MTRPTSKSGRCGYCGRRRMRRLLEWWDVIEEWRCKDADGCATARAKKKGGRR